MIFKSDITQVLSVDITELISIYIRLIWVTFISALHCFNVENITLKCKQNVASEVNNAWSTNLCLVQILRGWSALKLTPPTAKIKTHK